MKRKASKGSKAAKPSIVDFAIVVRGSTITLPDPPPGFRWAISNANLSQLSPIRESTRFVLGFEVLPLPSDRPKAKRVVRPARGMSRTGGDW